MRAAILLLCGVLLGACDRSEGGPVGAAGLASGTGDGAALSADGAADGPGAETDGGCKDLRHPGDGLDEGDDCWDPPLHYCSGGWSWGGPDFQCSPDGARCCNFNPGCKPCGWQPLPPCRPYSSSDPSAPECPDPGELAKDPVCSGYGKSMQPETEICWDGVEPPRR